MLNIEFFIFGYQKTSDTCKEVEDQQTEQDEHTAAVLV